jgi:hypothetical protein
VAAREGCTRGAGSGGWLLELVAAGDLLPPPLQPKVPTVTTATAAVPFCCSRQVAFCSVGLVFKISQAIS